MSAVRDILARKGSTLISVRPADTVLRAATRMNEEGIGGVLVMDGDDLAGIFTERDVLRRVVAAGLDPARTTVGQVLTSSVVTCEPQTSIDECAALMTARHIRHLPVLEAGRLVGLVTIGDILAFRVSEQQSTIEQMNNYLFDLR
jgi:CBS domain-containing protein